MVNYINEAEANGAVIDEATQVGMILETLSPNFLQFKSNYFMNKLQYNMTELLNELQTFESISKEKQAEANVAEANVAKAQSSSKKNKKRNKKNEGRNKVANGGKFKKKKNNNQDKKPKGKCFHCSLDGHWKRNYKKYLEELKQKKKGKFDFTCLRSLSS